MGLRGIERQLCAMFAVERQLRAVFAVIGNLLVAAHVKLWYDLLHFTHKRKPPNDGSTRIQPHLWGRLGRSVVKCGGKAGSAGAFRNGQHPCHRRGACAETRAQHLQLRKSTCRRGRSRVQAKHSIKGP